MSEFNFDKMKNIDIPESWVDGALNVEIEQKYPIPFLKYSKIIAFAASIVLVCSLSVALFFITNKNEAVPPIKNNETQCNTHVQISSTEIKNTENVTEKITQSDNTYSTETETQPVTEVLNTVEPTEENSDNNGESSSNSNPLKPNKHPENTDSVKPKPTENKEKPTKPNETQKPTDAPVIDDPPQDGPPEDNDELTSYISNFTNGKITAEIHWSDLSISIYCRMYDSKGNLVGDNDLYSSKREAIEADGLMVESQEYFSYEYNIDNLGESLKKGRYEVVFYNESGYCLCTGYITIS